MKGISSFIWIEVEFFFLQDFAKKISCNRAYCTSSCSNDVPVRRSSSITCGYTWLVRVRDVKYKKYKVSDHIVITAVCGTQYNTCESSYVE